MEALVPAFIVALLIQTGDRPAILTAILADRFGRPLIVAIAAGLAQAAGNLLAAYAATWVAPLLNPDAQALMLAIALFFAGIAALTPMRKIDRIERWRLGSLLTPLLAVFILALGDSTQFFTFAIAVRGEPWFAAAGAAAGAFAVGFVAAVIGEIGWSGLPLGKIRIAIGLLFLVAAAVVVLQAFWLV